jgi:predicted transposase YdaD
MLNLSVLRQTKVYQEAKEEGKRELISELVQRLIQRGFSVQEVAELLELDVEGVRRVI